MNNRRPNRFTRLLGGVAMAFAITMLLLPANGSAVADPCGRPNQVECIEYALQQLQGCIGSADYCADQFNRDYEGCMVLKGCASPPPPQM